MTKPGRVSTMARSVTISTRESGQMQMLEGITSHELVMSYDRLGFELEEYQVRRLPQPWSPKDVATARTRCD